MNRELRMASKVYGCTNEALEEEYYTVGYGDCIKLEYHEPKGEGDKHYVDITRTCGKFRMFEPTSIQFKEEH